MCYTYCIDFPVQSGKNENILKLKPTIKQFFPLLVIAALVAHPGLFLGFANAEQQPGHEIASIQKPFSAVAVVEVVQSAQVAVASSLSAVAKCAATNTSSGNFVQKASSINLNQPAECFSLQVFQAIYPESLKVQALQRTPQQLSVLYHKQSYTAGYAIPLPQPSTPVLPVLAIFLGVAAYVVFRKLDHQQSSSSHIQPYTYSLSIFELMVMRC